MVFWVNVEDQVPRNNYYCILFMLKYYSYYYCQKTSCKTKIQQEAAALMHNDRGDTVNIKADLDLQVDVHYNRDLAPPAHDPTQMWWEGRLSTALSHEQGGGTVLM